MEGLVVYFSGAGCQKRGKSFFLGGGCDPYRNYAVRLAKTNHLLTNFAWCLLQGRTFTVS